ncbi:MAG TPA: glycoside hydrolase family 78 protein [Verrucomicrobiae bacterium]|nr:glycoside hydrolase family 78 protein [Verrucomicrobiae bacterium]
MMRTLASLFVAASCIGSALSSSAELAVYDLRCENAGRPRGVDVPQPRFSWKLKSSERAQRQVAWQMLAASAPELLAREQGDLWDSGRVQSDQQLHVAYEGKPLQSLQAVFWKMRVWDAENRVSQWSAPATFTTGFMNEREWTAHWIEAPFTNQTLLLRREFQLKAGIERAVAVVCGLGQYELTVNGNRSGENLLSPGWTKYDRTCLYEMHDVTSLLRAGTNVVGIELAGGMYRVTGGRYVKFTGSFGPLKAIAELHLQYSDGTEERIVTDNQWRVRSGPITFSCVYGGEDHDARMEPRGWDSAGFDDTEWTAALIAEGPGGVLRGHSASAPPIRQIETLVPISNRVISNGLVVYDLGQNASLMPRIRVRGGAGSVVRIIPAELIKPDGTVDRGSVALGRPAWWQYTLRGVASEEWFPKFFYHGARYLQVEMKAAERGGALPQLESIVAHVVHSTAETTGEFECSNLLFNRVRSLVRWAQRSNMASVLTDCPHRERLGWLEQYHLNGPSLRYEFDLNQMFTKGMNDMQDCQLPNGCVPSTAPEYTIFGRGPDDVSNAFRNSPEWGSAVVLVPWQQYQFAGDVDLMRRHYDAMRRYVAYLASTATNGIVSFGLGDWYDIGPKAPGFAQLTPIPLTATAFYFEVNRVMSEVSRVLGRLDDSTFFDIQAQSIRKAFNREFFDPTKRQYATGSQCANAVPLVMNLVEPEHRAAVVEALVQDVRSRTNSVTAGDVGYRYVLRALADAGRSDVIFALNNQSDRPGYGYQLKMGATSLTEAWNARRGSSQNHFMLGQIMEWFYHDLAGIGLDPARPGFKNVLIRPQPVAGLTWARAKYDGVRGEVSSSWRREGNRFQLEITVPPNSTATVWVPGNQARATGAGTQWVRTERGNRDGSQFSVPSGAYTFESRL